MSQLQTIDEPGGALATDNQSNPIGAMLQAVVEKGITAESATAMERLVDLYERVELSNARKAFAAAKVKLQSELPKVLANRTIPGKDGTVRSRFADYQQIMDAIDAPLAEHGFSVSFNIRCEQGVPQRLTAICKLTHVDGHSETNEFAVRVGNGPPGCSEAQADGAARSYARRGALCDALNIVVDHDTDGRNLGDFISPAQAESLRARVAATGTNEARFLKVAGADSFEGIRATKYGMLDENLTKKERPKNPPPAEQQHPPEDTLAAQDQQALVDSWRMRAKAARGDKTIIEGLVVEIRRNDSWLGADKMVEIIREVRGGGA